jgi:hypothetical protein
MAAPALTVQQAYDDGLRRAGRDSVVTIRLESSRTADSLAIDVSALVAAGVAALFVTADGTAIRQLAVVGGAVISSTVAVTVTGVIVRAGLVCTAPCANLTLSDAEFVNTKIVARACGGLTLRRCAGVVAAMDVTAVSRGVALTYCDVTFTTPCKAVKTAVTARFCSVVGCFVVAGSSHVTLTHCAVTTAAPSAVTATDDGSHVTAGCVTLPHPSTVFNKCVLEGLPTHGGDVYLHGRAGILYNSTTRMIHFTGDAVPLCGFGV